MRSTPILRIVVALALAGFFLHARTPGLHSQDRAGGATQTISEVAWMAGDWQTASGGRAQIEEHWMQPAGGSMLGMSRTVAGGKTAEFEYLRLEQRPDGVYYVAHPKARCPGTDFKLTRGTAQDAVFENPQHDFPKRVIYRKNSDGSLTASIDAGEGTRSQSFAYLPMKR